LISKKTDIDTFQKFGGSVFQTKLIQSLILDVKFFARIFSILKKEYFTNQAHQFLFEKINEYYEKYKLVPSFEILEIIVTSEQDELIRTVAHEILKVIKKSSVADTKMIKDEALLFCRQQRMKAAIYNSVKRFEENDWEGIWKDVGDAFRAGEDNDSGHDYFEELDHRLEKLKREIVPTGLKDLDTLLGGGMGKGELIIVVGGPSIGKSFFMQVVSANVVLQNKNVIYYTLELYEHQVGVRFDSRFSGISIDDVPTNKEFVKNKLINLSNKGKFKIKEYPAKTSSVNILRMHLNKLMMENFIPDLIVVDYADLLKGRKGINEKRFELESIYEDLRALAYDFNVPVLSASQANKAEYNNEVVTIASLAESFAKAAVADIIITISRRMDDKLSTPPKARMFIAKNRAGKDGVIIPLQPFDIGTMQLETKTAITDNETLKKEISKLTYGDEEQLKRSLSKKYDKFKKKDTDNEDTSKS